PFPSAPRGATASVTCIPDTDRWSVIAHSANRQAGDGMPTRALPTGSQAFPQFATRDKRNGAGTVPGETPMFPGRPGGGCPAKLRGRGVGGKQIWPPRGATLIMELGRAGRPFG